MLNRIELIPAWVGENRNSALSQHRLVPIEVEEVAQPHTDDQHWIHRGVDVVRTEVRNADGHDVRLALDSNADLVSNRFQSLLVYRIDLAGVHACEPVGCAHRVEDAALESRRRDIS